MAETDPVRIIVEVVDQFSDDLAELRGQLEELDFKNIDVDLDVEDEGDIESIKAQLKALQERLEAEFDIDTDGFAEAMAKKQALRGDIDSDVNFNTSGLMDAEQIRSVREFSRDTLNQTLRGIVDDDGWFINSDDMGVRGEGLGNMLDDNAALDFQRSIGAAQERASDAMTDRSLGLDPTGRYGGGAGFRRLFGQGPDIPGAAIELDFLEDGGPLSRKDMGRGGLGRQMKNFAEGADNLGKTLLQYRPSIMDWWNVMALLIPVMLTLVGAVIGLTAALVALGAAAATIAGVGLLGWGDSMQESFQNLKQEAMELGKTLFDVLQPAANAFQPLQADAMDAIPSLVADLVGPMQRLTVFKDELAEMGVGFVEWMEEGMNAAVALNEQIGNILMRFGSALGTFLIEVLDTMVRDVYRNQDAYINLGAILMDLVVAIFNVVKAVAFAVSQFRVLFDGIAALTNLLTNKWAVTLITTIGLIVALETAIATAATALLAMGGVGLTGWAWSVFPYLTAGIYKLYAFVAAANTATAAMTRLLALTGVGLIAAGGALAVSDAVTSSMTPPNNAGRTQGGGNTFINVEGDVEKRQMDRLLDKVPSKTRTEMNMQAGMEG